jgi:hypothetical protein
MSVALLVAMAVIFLLPGGASACACGNPKGVIVARGQSLYGVPWWIKASLVWPATVAPATLEAHFSISPRGGFSGVGYFTGAPLPLPAEFVFSALEGSGIDRYPESDLSGIARRKVVTLVIEMSDGETMMIHPRLSPPRVWRRFPWLAGVRFYDVFFPSRQESLVATAYDRDGQMIKRLKSHFGLFY